MLQRFGNTPVAGRILMAVLGLTVLVGLSAGAISVFSRERGDLDMTISSAASEPRIPAIDMAAPNQFETATFALG